MHPRLPARASPPTDRLRSGNCPQVSTGGAPQTNTKAVIALGLSIAAYTPVIPFIGAVVALFLSRSARREIRASGGAQTGEGLCRWATGLAIAHLIFVALLVVAVAALLIVPFSFS